MDAAASIGVEMASLPRYRRAMASLLLFVFVVAACGDDTVTTDAGQEVIFGEGEIPATVPDGFPVPASGVIGSTMIDRINHKTEFSVQMAAGSTPVAQFFEVELVNRGYVVTSSMALSESVWQIQFILGELAGVVSITSVTTALSQVIVTLNVA